MRLFGIGSLFLLVKLSLCLSPCVLLAALMSCSTSLLLDLTVLGLKSILKKGLVE